MLWLLELITVAVHSAPLPSVSVKYSLPIVVAGLVPCLVHTLDFENRLAVSADASARTVGADPPRYANLTGASGAMLFLAATPCGRAMLASRAAAMRAFVQ